MKTGLFTLLLLAFVANIVGAAPARERRPVVLSTDCGTEMDDQWALALLALSPAVELRGVVGAHAPNLAPPAAETAARTAREVLAHLNLKHSPRVVAGSSLPLADTTTPIASEGTKLLLREAHSFSPQRRLAVLVIGSATDIASALLLDPTLADRTEVIAVAFDRWPQGGDPWNVRNDVRAWQVLLASRVPLTIGPTDTCVRHLVLTRAAARDMLSSTGDPGKYLLSILEGWLDRQPDAARSVTGRPDAWPVWDLISVADLLGLATTETHPRPRLRDDVTFDLAGTSAGEIRWITSLDERHLWDQFVRLVKEAGQTRTTR
jgi:inosine-uridine nucleoside N-ribohydrolase